MVVYVLSILFWVFFAVVVADDVVMIGWFWLSPELRELLHAYSCSFFCFKIRLQSYTRFLVKVLNRFVQYFIRIFFVEFFGIWFEKCLSKNRPERFTRILYQK